MVHVFDLEQRRENLAIQRLLTGIGIPTASGWLQHLGWNPANCWFALNIPTSACLSAPPEDAPGDLDVVGGPLEAPDAEWAESMQWARDELPNQPDEFIRGWAWTRCISRGEVVWPPRMDLVAAAEFKSARFNIDGRTISKTHREKYQHDARGQARGLCNLGFRRTALVHVLGGAPHVRAGDPDGAPWLRAAEAGRRAGWWFGGELLIEEDDPFATLVLPFSAVTGRDETLDGATGRPEFWNEGIDNPAAEDQSAIARREAITSVLAGVLSNTPFPRHVPVLVLACISGRCGNLYVSNNGSPESPCPRCGAPPTITAI